MSNVEEPDYKIVTAKENMEIRDYPSMVLAEVVVSGERKEAINKGFKILADYIFGNNTSEIKKDMTAFARGENSEKIAMTAPVMQEQRLDHWKVSFVMPKKYSFQTLPKPNSKEVVLISSPARRFAVIRFSGLVNDESINQQKHQLEVYIKAENLKTFGSVILAFYNPPWTLPFLRRNEIMMEIGIDQ